MASGVGRLMPIEVGASLKFPGTNDAVTLAATAKVAPTERSMPRVRMTSVMPTAMMPVIETTRAMSRKLLIERKFGDSRLSPIMRASRNSAGTS